MKCAELKKILETIPDNYEVVFREHEGLLCNYPVFNSKPITDWTVITEYKELGLYAESETEDEML